jgi:hypothetical protein
MFCRGHVTGGHLLAGEGEDHIQRVALLRVRNESGQRG